MTTGLRLGGMVGLVLMTVVGGVAVTPTAVAPCHEHPIDCDDFVWDTLSGLQCPGGPICPALANMGIEILSAGELTVVGYVANGDGVPLFALHAFAPGEGGSLRFILARGHVHADGEPTSVRIELPAAVDGLEWVDEPVNEFAMPATTVIQPEGVRFLAQTPAGDASVQVPFVVTVDGASADGEFRFRVA